MMLSVKQGGIKHHFLLELVYLFIDSNIEKEKNMQHFQHIILFLILRKANNAYPK